MNKVRKRAKMVMAEMLPATSRRKAFIEGIGSILDIAGVASHGNQYGWAQIVSLDNASRRYNKTDRYTRSDIKVLASDLKRASHDLESATKRFRADLAKEMPLVGASRKS